MPEQIKNFKETQNEIAVTELENVLKHFIDRHLYNNGRADRLILSDADVLFVNFVNNRIKQLGGDGLSISTIYQLIG